MYQGMQELLERQKEMTAEQLRLITALKTMAGDTSLNIQTMKTFISTQSQSMDAMNAAMQKFLKEQLETNRTYMDEQRKTMLALIKTLQKQAEDKRVEDRVGHGSGLFTAIVVIGVSGAVVFATSGSTAAIVGVLGIGSVAMTLSSGASRVCYKGIHRVYKKTIGRVFDWISKKCGASPEVDSTLEPLLAELQRASTVTVVTPCPSPVVPSVTFGPEVQNSVAAPKLVSGDADKISLPGQVSSQAIEKKEGKDGKEGELITVQVIPTAEIGSLETVAEVPSKLNKIKPSHSSEFSDSSSSSAERLSNIAVVRSDAASVSSVSVAKGPKAPAKESESRKDRESLYISASARRASGVPQSSQRRGTQKLHVAFAPASPTKGSAQKS